MIQTFILNFAQAAICDPNVAGLCNPTRAGSLDEFVTNILTGLMGLVGMVTIAMILYSGLRMILAQGSEERITKAKAAFQWSIAGFVVTLFAYITVSAVAQFFHARDINPTPGQVESPIESQDIFALSRTVFTGFLVIVGSLAMFFIIINGFRYLTARGNEEQVMQARKGLQWAIIGLIITALAYVIVVATARLFGANVTG